MKTLRLTVLKKGLLLIAIPLICEVIVVATLFQLNQALDEEVARANRANEISTAINEFIKAFMDEREKLKTDVPETGRWLLFQQRALFSDQGPKALAKLRKLVGNDPDRLKVIADVEQRIKQLQAVFAEVQFAIDTATVIDLKEVKARAGNIGRQITEGPLIEMAEQEEAFQKGSSVRVAEYNKKIELALYSIVGVSVLLSGVILYVFNRGLSRRLDIIKDNSLRLSRGEALNEPIDGSDEIALLDEHIHMMAEALAEGTKRERSIVQNARDLICALDENNRFAKTNPACWGVLGYTQEELSGKDIETLVATDAVQSAIESLELLRLSPQVFETRLVRKDGKVIDVSVAGQWASSIAETFAVIHDISEIKDSERVKQEVVAMVTHDLRTPLTTVRHVHEMLLDDEDNGFSPEQQQKLQSAEHSAQRVMWLASNLLDMDKSAAGRLAILVDRIALNDLFEKSIETLAPFAMQRSVTLEYEPSDLFVSADESRFKQVLTNLLLFIIDYGKPGNSVKLSSGRIGGRATVKLREEGGGFEPDLLDSVFGEYASYRISPRFGTAGLALAVARILVELHEGSEIWVERSDQPGLTFCLTVKIDQ